MKSLAAVLAALIGFAPAGSGLARQDALRLDPTLSQPSTLDDMVRSLRPYSPRKDEPGDATGAPGATGATGAIPVQTAVAPLATSVVPVPNPLRGSLGNNPVIGPEAVLPAAPTRSAKPAAASAGRGLDTTADIAIEADRLEILQDQKVAIFAGAVDAVQGGVRLQADEVRVHYEPVGGGDEALGDISRLDAKGRVFVTSLEETAKGEWAAYDVPGKRITMGGTVTLTRGENVIRGSRLEIDLATGRSRIDGGTRPESAKGSDIPQPASGRVRGIFANPNADKASGASGGAR